MIFRPLQLVCTNLNYNDLKVIALDCIEKLFSFSYLDNIEEPSAQNETDAAAPQKMSLMDQAVKTVCDCFKGEGTDKKVELQVVKALTACILNDNLVAHGVTLMKAIRLIYTVYVVSNSPSNQTIAQATLNQVINVIFERIKSAMKGITTAPNTPSIDRSRFSVSSSFDSRKDEETESTNTENKLTLQQMEALGSGESLEEEIINSDDTESQIFAKDGYLVFRTLCKLSEKSLGNEVLDYKSHAMRSKLLSLHLIYTILISHMTVFLSNDVIITSHRGDETLLIATKDYLCSALARNAASLSPPVFEISAEIFWVVLSNLRFQYKKEIEVFFAEIYFPITEMKTSTMHQKRYFLSVVQKVSNDPRALVEIFLNYDCDSSAMNIYEALIDYLVKLAVSPVHLTPAQQELYLETKSQSYAVYNISLPPAIAVSNLISQSHHEVQYPFDHALKMTALASLVAVLRSLLSWAQRGYSPSSAASGIASGQQSISEISIDPSSPVLTHATSPLFDDPSQFHTLKIKKREMEGAVRLFNTKPKKGIQAFVDTGFISNSHDAKEIAKLLLETEGLDKALIGEYLGEGYEENIQIMHAFVDLMDFSNMKFVDAMRMFLQAFRLPGEAQKIDRFMLKFAERYISGNPNVFANADTAYVLAYSVILLNTDLHSPQIKVRMSVEDFIKNNRGINDNADLPEEMLVEIYDTIRGEEIKLQSEQHAALLSSNGTNNTSGLASIGQALATVGRNLQREAYLQASREMSNKTEQMFKSIILKGGKKRENEKFFVASHYEHVKPMFQVAWMSILAGLSGPFQQSEDPDTISLCLTGFKYSIRIACIFDIDLARISFMSALAQFTNLQKLSEMRHKNVEAVKQLLDTALNEGNNLKSSWKAVLTCISQLERFQLISSGIEAGSIPDVTNARLASRVSVETTKANRRSSIALSVFGGFSRSAPPPQSPTMSGNGTFSSELGEEVQTREIIINMDKIFTKSSSLNGDAIVDFVKALTEVSWEEIQSSGFSEHPRTFSLQKMVDVSYYNMERVRLEWSRLWSIMGKTFNKVGSHKNTNVAFFALDSLRQLSMRFFDLNELSYFKFQKDFLKPFEYVMAHNDNVEAQDMVLQCLRQMILAKSENIKSGWRTMFATFAIAGKQTNLTIVGDTLSILTQIMNENFDNILTQGAFGSFVGCLSTIGKNVSYQKKSLQALKSLKSLIDKIIPLTPKVNNQLETVSAESEVNADEELFNKYWFPILYSLHDVIMNGEDLEVRSRALNHFFDILTVHGSRFSGVFWDTICRQLLFPTFMVLKSRSEMARFNTQDDMSVWLSTTMIQALRNMIALLAHYFDILSSGLSGFLELLVTCILQENETVSRIGASCLMQLIEQNVSKLTEKHWILIVNKLEFLFEATTAHELFGVCTDFEDTSEEDNMGLFKLGSAIQRPETDVFSHPKAGHISPTMGKNTHSRTVSWGDNSHTRQIQFRKSIVKCILQLLMIDTLQELLEKPGPIDAESPEGDQGLMATKVYIEIPEDQMIRVLILLRKSYEFARNFNNDKELRIRLWKQGFMKQMPNLLKQESYAAHCYISVMFRLYETDSRGLVSREQAERYREMLLPLCMEVVSRFTSLDQDSELKTFNTWTPVIISILEGFERFSKEDWSSFVSTQFYPLLLNFLDFDMSPELRFALKSVLRKVNV